MYTIALADGRLFGARLTYAKLRKAADMNVARVATKEGIALILSDPRTKVWLAFVEILVTKGGCGRILADRPPPASENKWSFMESLTE